LAARQAKAREVDMEYGIALMVAVGLGIYLIYALLRPEKF
jgi:K+-transporting ATPase KdpF subunit